MNGRGCLQTGTVSLLLKISGVEVGDRNAPNETFDILCLKLLAGWYRDVKYGKRGGDVKEQGSKSEMSAGTNPVTELFCGVR